MWQEISIPSLEKYMSESLDWGKWSSFRQNRHIEEAEKISKPGSVAQKKAYFEDHYKRKAAARHEQANAAATGSAPVEETSAGGNHHEYGDTISTYAELQLALLPVEAMANKTAGQVVQKPDADASISVYPPGDFCSNDDVSGELMIDQVDPSRTLTSHPPSSSPMEKHTHESPKSEEKYVVVNDQTVREALPSRAMSTGTIGDVENENAMTETEPSRASQPVKPLQGSSAANQDISLSKEKKQKALVSRWTIFSRTSTASPSSVKPVTPRYPRKENVSNFNKKPSCDKNDKKMSAPKSLHMPINLSSQKPSENTASSTSKSTPKNENLADSKRVIALSKTSPCTPHHECPPVTSTWVLAAGVPKDTLTPQSDTRSTRMPTQKTDPKSRKVNTICHSVTTDCWKSSSSSWKRSSHIVCSPFSFRCDERAERRKEFFLKLEEKLNAEKLQRQEKAKEMAENELKRLRQSLGFKARPMPDFYRKNEPSKNEIKKITLSQGPRLGRKVNPLEFPVTSCLPSLRPSTRKAECNATGKSNGKLSNSPSLGSVKKRADNMCS